ncbi:MAG: hypothetical protein WCC21_12690 [Candidatus Acidiferrales bacterium]
MNDGKTKSPPTHTPGPWKMQPLKASSFHANGYVGDERLIGFKIDNGSVEDIVTVDCRGKRDKGVAQANARLIVKSPDLLIALEDAFALLDRISDILHYEDGLPVTFLESRDIEIIYGDAVTELARFETLIREARGQQ